MVLASADPLAAICAHSGEVAGLLRIYMTDPLIAGEWAVARRFRVDGWIAPPEHALPRRIETMLKALCDRDSDQFLHTWAATWFAGGNRSRNASTRLFAHIETQAIQRHLQTPRSPDALLGQAGLALAQSMIAAAGLQDPKDSDPCASDIRELLADSALALVRSDLFHEFPLHKQVPLTPVVVIAS